MVIRAMVAADRIPLGKVYAESRSKAFSWLDAAARERGDFDRDTQGETVLVAEQSGRVVGFVALWLPDNFIHHLYVLPACENRGHGSALLAAGLQILGRPASLKCLSMNAKALDFYRARGWRTRAKGVSEDGEYHLMELP